MTKIHLGQSCKRIGELDKYLEILVQNQLTHMELQVDNIDEDSYIYNTQVINKLKNLKKDYDLTLSLHSFDGINLGEKVNRIRKTCIQIVTEILNVGEELGCEHVTLHLGNCGFRYDNPKKRARLDIAMDSINQLLTNTQGYKVKVGIENIDRLVTDNKCYLGDCLADFQYIFANMDDSRLGMIFDLGHANLVNSDVPALFFLRQMSEKIIGVHLHWNDGMEDLHHGLPINWCTEHTSIWEIIKNKLIILENHNLEEIMKSIQSIHENGYNIKNVEN